MRIRLLIGILFITTAFSPLVANQISPVFEETLGIEFSEEPEISEDMITELPGIRIVESAGGRAPCPTIQSDAGVAGDAGNTSNTSRPLGQNPTTSKTGCMDATDDADVITKHMTACSHAVLQIDGIKNASLKDKIKIIIDLLDDVRQLGTPQFSRMARLAFIGNQYL